MLVTKPPHESTVTAWLDLVQSYGPGMAGWVMAIGAFSLCAWLVGGMAKAHNRHTRSVLEMSESLRATLRLEKDHAEQLRQKCEDECRAKDRLIQQLNEQHSFARGQLMEEARQHRELAAERERANQRLTREVEALVAKVHALHAEIDAMRAERPRTQRTRSTDK